MDFNLIIEYFKDLFSSDIWNWNYVESVWYKYLTFTGFIAGAVLIVFIVLASDFNDDFEFLDFDFWNTVIRMLALVSLVNALDGIYYELRDFINVVLFQTDTMIFSFGIDGAFNPISILIICMVTVRCYKVDNWRAFFFGLSSFGISIILSDYIIDINVIVLIFIVRVLLAGLICYICSFRRYVFTSYIWLGCYYIISDILEKALIYSFESLQSPSIDVSAWLDEANAWIPYYKAEYVIMGSLIVIWALLELVILKKPKSVSTTAETA